MDTIGISISFFDKGYSNSYNNSIENTFLFTSIYSLTNRNKYCISVRSWKGYIIYPPESGSQFGSINVYVCGENQ